MANQELKKHIAAIHISNKLTLLQRKAANVLLLNAYEDLLKKEKHSIKIKGLAYLIGFDSHNLDVLKDALRGLMSTVLEWNLLNEHGYEDGWEASTMLASVRIQRGVCIYSYSQALREKLYNPEIYARINLGIQRKLSSGYALALYENCLRYKKTHSTGWIELETFRRLMGVPDDKYNDFKRFSSRVIRDPIQQINASSDIFLEAEYQRNKRKVTAIRIKVTENPQLSLFTNKLMESELKLEPLSLEHDDREQISIRKRLLEFGLSLRQAQKMLAQFAIDYIRENLELVERDYQAGKVENLPAYTLAALREDYRPHASQHELQQIKAARSQQAADEQQSRQRAEQEILKKSFERQRLQLALDELTEADHLSLVDRFCKYYERNPIYVKWAKKGMDHPVIQSLFRSYASNALLQQSTEEEFMAYLANQSHSSVTHPRA